MSYNRWISSSYDLELYHHGVKGMKWGKRLFGKGAEMPQGAGGGGGGGNKDDLALLEKLKELYGDKAYEKFLEAKKNRGEAVEFSKLMQNMAKDTRGEDGLHKVVTELLSTRHRQYNEAKAAYERSPKGIVDKVSQKGRSIIDRFKSADIKGAAAKQTGRGVSTAVKRLSAPTVIASENTRAKVERDKKERAWEAYKRSNADRRHAEYVDELKAKHRARKEREKHQQAMDQLAEDRRKYNEKNRPANLPRSRRRKISQNGTGVHLTTPIGKRWP